MAAPIGSLLVLTEDSGADGHATIIALLKRMLRLIAPEYQSHRLGVEPRDEAAQRAVRGTGWKSADPRVTDMLRTIATKLGRDDGFVFFHVDGDRPWRDRASSENRAKFEGLIRNRVRQLLAGRAVASSADTDRRIARLFLIVPFYSVEAWLYQHTEVALELCRDHYQGRDVERFDAWRQDRASLEEVVQPKDAVCLGATHNLALAGPRYPADEVYAAERSYTETVHTLLACDDLTALLQKTASHDP